MDVLAAQRRALSLMRAFGLRGWTFATNKRKKTLGLCFSQLKRIELSTNFIAHNPKSIVRETVLHEIAHALVGTEHGHGAVWKEMAERVGAKPSRTTKNVVMPPGKWQATCGGCGLLFSRHRRPNIRPATAADGAGQKLACSITSISNRHQRAMPVRYRRWCHLTSARSPLILLQSLAQRSASVRASREILHFTLPDYGNPAIDMQSPALDISAVTGG